MSRCGRSRESEELVQRAAFFALHMIRRHHYSEADAVEVAAHQQEVRPAQIREWLCAHGKPKVVAHERHLSIVRGDDEPPPGEGST